MNLTVVCFTSNLLDRGTCRVRNFLYSISHQDGIQAPPQVIIVDVSNDGSFKSIRKFAKEYKAMCIHAPLPADGPWNKCVALNAGLNEVNTRYTMFTDIDYIFAPNFFSIANKRMSSKRFLLCRTHDSGKHQDFTDYDHSKFDDIIARCKAHKRCGMGACQLALTRWFRRHGGYDERMQMWGVMDNDIVLRAKRSKLDVVWIDKKTSIIHQWHVSNKKSAKKHKEKNVKIYRNDNTIKRNVGQEIGQLPGKKVYDYR